MVKHRIKKTEAKKKLTKWNIILPVILGAAGTALAFGVNYFVAGPPPLTQCVPSENLDFNQDASLYVILDGKPLDIPSDVGRTGNCLKAIHTHDNDTVEEDGIKWTRIHTSYVKPTRFTLSDFVNLWGLDLKKYDVKTSSKLPAENSFKEVQDIRSLVLTNKIKIKMELTSK